MPLTSPIPTPHLILGGTRSGKSTYAESLITALDPPYVYIATAHILDSEMEARVLIHRLRRNSSWKTLEEPLALTETLAEIAPHGRPVLIDCLTIWLSNLLLQPSNTQPEEALSQFCAFLETASFPIFVVSNEVGSGIVPDNPLARRFRDLAGFANRQVALASGAVTLVVAGIPLRLK